MTIRLIPRLMAPTAIEAMVGWLNDPEVVQYSEQRHNTHTIQSQIDYLNSFRGLNQIKMIVTDDTIIGTITAYVDPHNSVADVGILIGHKASWGNGYGYQAWKVFCDSLFESGIRKIEAGHMSTNLGMKRICEKYGMFVEGFRIEHFGIFDMVMWGKLRDQEAV